jgi:hypothetical protein
MRLSTWCWLNVLLEIIFALFLHSQLEMILIDVLYQGKADKSLIFMIWLLIVSNDLSVSVYMIKFFLFDLLV